MHLWIQAKATVELQTPSRPLLPNRYFFSFGERDTCSVLHTVQINFQAVDVNKYRYIQTPIGLLIF